MQRTIGLLGTLLLVGAALQGLAGCTANNAAATASAAVAPTLADVITRNTQARGGAAALDRMKAIAVDVEIVEGGMTLNGRYAATADGLVRVDVYTDGKLVASEGIDANGVWILTEEGPRPSVATGAANALKHGADNHLFGWHRFAGLGHRLTLMPAETFDGTIYPVVGVRYSTGHLSYFYVDPVSWQVVRRRDERAYHPDVSQAKQRVESRSMDFQSVDGIVAAHRTEDYDIDSGKLLSVNRVLQRRINPQLTANYFDRDRPAPASF